MSTRNLSRGGKSHSMEDEESVTQKFRKHFKNLPPTFRALITVLTFFTFTLFSVPIFIYRFVLSKFVVPQFFSKTIGRPVTPSGNIFSVEFLREKFSPRCAIVTNFVVEGEVEPQEVWETIEAQWIKRKMSNSTELRFPELKQYVGSWMGFMFWKNDSKFHLRNHLHFHELPETENDPETSEKFVSSLMEELLNKPFPPERSPWEIHTIKNCTSSELETEKGKPITVFVFRFHHALADGFSILYAVIEGLFGMSLSEISLPSTDAISITPERTFFELVEYFSQMFVTFVAKIVNDLDYLSSLVYRPRTSWHVSDKRKTWTQLYARSQLIPIQRIKEVRDKFEVSFTGVLFSCISAGVAKSLKRKKLGHGQVESLPTLIPLPLLGHPKKLENHIAGTVFDLPIKSDLMPACRLMECERRLQIAKKTTIPLLGLLYSTVVGSHLALICKSLLRNTVLPMGLSNFPGPSKEIIWKGRRGLSADFVAGAVNGVAGVGFMVLSYRNHLRIAATAENAVMTREELNDLVKNVCDEIAVLEDAVYYD